MNPLLDKQFLKQLDENKNKVIYAKVIALTLEENPTQEITGIVSAGNINIDGKSAVRRSCSLTLISTLKNMDEIDISLSDYYWGLNTKFKLYIGIENNINPNYDNIIWFNQGIFLITSFSSTLNTNSFNISISGKDKMCLLNGDVGGTIPAEVCFGVLEDYNEETDTNDTKDLPIKEIIKEAVHAYGGEPYHNIIINLDDIGWELLEYQGEKDLYLITYHQKSSKTYIDIREGKTACYTDQGKTSLENLSWYDNLNSGLNYDIIQEEPTHFWFSWNQKTNPENYYTALKVPYGTVIGYKETDLTYPDAEKLVIKAGESVVTLLDKITKTFSEYEYFYNVDGQFVFQKKRTYLNTTFNNLEKDFETGEVYGTSAANTSAITYSFEDGNLITAYTNTPNLGNLKNDFVCWGIKTTENGTQLPIHMRYSIDTKPQYYMSVQVNIDEILNNSIYADMPAKKKTIKQKYIDVLKILNDSNNKNNILSQYFLNKNLSTNNELYYVAYNSNKNIYVLTTSKEQALYAFNNKTILYQDNTFYFSHNWYNKQSFYIRQQLTNLGYEPYDWREILYKMSYDYNQYGVLNNFNGKLRNANSAKTINNLLNSQDTSKSFKFVNEDLYFNNKTGYEQYYTDMISFWRQLYDPTLKYNFIQTDEINLEQEELFIQEEYRQINDVTELYELAEKNEIYIKRTYDNNTFLAPLLDCIFLDYKIISDKQVLQGNHRDVYTDDSKGNKIRVTILNGLKKKNLYFKYAANKYEKLDSYIITRNNIATQTDYFICVEDENGKTKASTLKNAIDNGKVYYKLKNGDYINPTTYKTTDAFLYNLYCNFDNNKFSYKEKYPIYQIETNGYQFNTNKLNLTQTNIFYKKNYENALSGVNKYWNYTAIYTPSKLNFWFDMLDSSSSISKYSVKTLGSRLKVDNNNQVKAIYYEEIPTIVYHYPNEYRTMTSLKNSSGYDHLWLSDELQDSIVLSGQSISAKNAIDDLIYNYIHCNETISLTAIPIYYLEPNTRIYVHDPNTQIMGEYIIDKISLSLTYNGTMNISATKAVQRIN